jgi:hypothetical protein
LNHRFSRSSFVNNLILSKNRKIFKN